MKKVSLVFFALLISLTFSSLARTFTPADFFVGKWELTILGTPNGDAKMIANLVRKDGKLTGEMVSAAANGPKEPNPITKIDEEKDKITLYFTTQGYDVNVDLSKVDDDNLKGQMMGMFDTTAKRLK